MEFMGIRDEMTSHFLTLLRNVRVACDDNSSKFFEVRLEMMFTICSKMMTKRSALTGRNLTNRYKSYKSFQTTKFERFE